MITGRWGKPSEVLLDLVVEEDGSVRGVANPGRQDAPIRQGRFDAITGAVTLEGEHVRPDGTTLPFRIAGRLDGRTLRLTYQYGDMRGETDVVRVEEYTPPRLTFWDRLKSRIDGLKRRINARSRPTGEENARKLRERGESLDSISFRDAVAADIPALAELHVTTWNATYNTARGPTIATRTWQWNQVFAKEDRRDFVLVLQDQNGRLIGFTWGKISPKKTVEGLVGGLIAAIITGYAARWWFLSELSSLDCLILATLLTITGLWGDLTESAIKRSVGMKDSGRILPGHGGMLDRLDSLLFTAPVFYYYVTMASRLRVIE